MSVRPERTGGLAAPAWAASIKPGGRVVARPAAASAFALSIGAGLVWLAASVYGAYAVDALWGTGAAIGGIATLVLTLRTFPALALLPALLGVLSWGLVTRAWLPDSLGDLLGVLRFAGGNLLYALPLLASYLSAIDVDGRREARRKVDEAVSERSWWGEPDPDPAVRALQAIPSARFFALRDGGPAALLVVAGRRVALLFWSTWPDGDYQMSGRGEIIRAGRPFADGTEDVDALARQVRGWLERLHGTDATCTGFLVVHPPRDGHSDDLYLNIAPGERLQIVHAARFLDTVGGWLAAEPHRLDVYVIERVLATLGHDRPSVPAYRPRHG